MSDPDIGGVPLSEESNEALKNLHSIVQMSLDDESIADLAYDQGIITEDERDQYNEVESKIHADRLGEIEEEIESREELSLSEIAGE